MGHPHSVLGPLSAVQYCTPSQIGWQICSARCPDPALLFQLLVTLVQPLDCHARLHVSYMCSVLHPLASGPYASRSTPKVRPVYLHSIWCPSTSVPHCAPYTPGRLIAVLDIQASPSQLTYRSLFHTLAHPAPAAPVPRLHLAIAPFPPGTHSLLRSYGSLPTYSAALIQVTSHLQRRCVIHTHCHYRSFNPTQARCLLHLPAVATSICSIHYYPSFGDISAQDGRYLSCPFIWASFYWSPKRNWQGYLYRC